MKVFWDDDHLRAALMSGSLYRALHGKLSTTVTATAETTGDGPGGSTAVGGATAVGGITAVGGPTAVVPE